MCVCVLWVVVIVKIDVCVVCMRTHACVRVSCVHCCAPNATHAVLREKGTAA